MSTEIAAPKWRVRLDDGQASDYGSLRSAADMARTILKTGHPCEIWHRQTVTGGGGLVSDEWRLYERLEPQPAAPVTADELRADIVRGAHQIADWKAGR